VLRWQCVGCDLGESKTRFADAKLGYAPNLRDFYCACTNPRYISTYPNIEASLHRSNEPVIRVQAQESGNNKYTRFCARLVCGPVCRRLRITVHLSHQNPCGEWTLVPVFDRTDSGSAIVFLFTLSPFTRDSPAAT